MLFDGVAFQIPRIDDLWVDVEHGDDGNDGLAPATALATIQAAANLAGPGTTVHIQPGIYRETVWPLMDCSAGEPALYLAEIGPGTAVIRGLEPADLAGSSAGTLIVTSTHAVPLLEPGLWYEIPIQGSGGGFAGTSTAELIVGGWRAYLPVTGRD